MVSKTVLASLAFAFLICLCEARFVADRTSWTGESDQQKMAHLEREQGERRQKMSVVASSESESDSSDSNESKYAKFMKIQHYTDPEQAGNGQQKPNQMRPRQEVAGSMKMMEGRSSEENALNQINKD